MYCKWSNMDRISCNGCRGCDRGWIINKLRAMTRNSWCCYIWCRTATEVAALLLVVAVSFEFSLPVVDLDICLLAVVVEILLVVELACWLVVVAVENWWIAEDTLVALLAVIVLIDDTSEVAPEVAALTLVVLGLDVWSAFPCTGFANIIPKTLLITTIELSSTILWLVFLLYVLHFFIEYSSSFCAINEKITTATWLFPRVES